MSSEDDKNPRSGGGEGTRPRNQTTGIDELRGWSNCVYGEPKQAEKYLRTTRKIADHVGTTKSKEKWNLEQHELEEFKFPDPPELVETPTRTVMRIETAEKFRMLLRMIHDKDNTTNKIKGLSKFWEWQESNDVKGTRGFQDRLDRATSQCVW
jgi:hypothetical protein